MLSVDPRRPAAHIDREGRGLREMEHRAAGGTFLVLGDTDLEPGEVEFECPRARKIGARNEPQQIVGRRPAHPSARSISSRCARRCSDRWIKKGRSRDCRKRSLFTGRDATTRSTAAAASLACRAATCGGVSSHWRIPPPFVYSVLASSALAGLSSSRRYFSRRASARRSQNAMCARSAEAVQPPWIRTSRPPRRTSTFASRRRPSRRRRSSVACQAAGALSQAPPRASDSPSPEDTGASRLRSRPLFRSGAPPLSPYL